MPGKLETTLSPDEVRSFCKRLAAMPGGTALRVIIAEAARHGVSLTNRSATTVRNGPLAAVLAELQTNTASAATIAAVAQDGRGMADATAVLLLQRLFAKLQNAGEFDARELEQFCLVQFRLQTGIHRTRRLEADLHALTEKLSLREKELALAREKFDEGKKTGIERGLDALHAQVRDHPAALELFEKFRDVVRDAAAGKAAA